MLSTIVQISLSAHYVLMSTSSPSWELYGTFLAVMREGSLSAASRALGLAQPTVRRRIEALEQALDVVLFTRATNGLVPTEAAASTVSHAQAMAASADALVRAASAPLQADRGTVRVAASETVGGEVLPALLSPLLDAHPGLAIELVLGNRNEDLLRRDADVAVRMVRPTQRALVARRVGAVPLGLFASEAYVGAHGLPSKPVDLARHRLVGQDKQRGLIDGLASIDIATTPRDFAFRSDSDLAQLAAVRGGAGIGVCQLPLAPRWGLRRVLPAISFALDCWVVTHEDLRDVRRVRVVCDHLVAALTRYIGAVPSRGRSRR